MTTDAATMTTFVTSDLDMTDRYKLLTGLVVPRPIGWIGTCSSNGTNNLAPYSFFNAVSADPPTVLFSAGTTARKDSAANAVETGEFTVNIVGRAVAEAMNTTSASVAEDVDEFELAGLTAVPGVLVGAPRVAEAAAQFECTVTHSMHVGRAGGGNLVVFGEVVAMHVADDVLDGTRVDQQRLHPVGRHAGNWYSDATDLFELIRPA